MTQPTVSSEVLAFRSVVSDLLCDPGVRRHASPSSLREATKVLADSLGVPDGLLDLESRRVAAKKEHAEVAHDCD